MNRQRKTVLLLILSLCLLTACGREPEEPAGTAWTPVQMARAVWDSQPPLEGYALTCDGGDFAPYLRDTLGIDPADVADGAVLYAGGVSAQEVVVLRMAEEENLRDALKALKDYAYARAGAFAGYAPEQYAIAEGAATAERGQYAALLIVPDQDAARDALAGCFLLPPPEPEEPPSVPSSAPADLPPDPEPEPAPVPEPEEPEKPEEPEEPEPDPEPVPEPDPGPEATPEPDPEPEPPPPPEPWSYDRSRIVDAWTSGDRTGLYPEDLEILAVLDQIPRRHGGPRLESGAAGRGLVCRGRDLGRPGGLLPGSSRPGPYVF